MFDPAVLFSPSRCSFTSAPDQHSSGLPPRHRLLRGQRAKSSPPPPRVERRGSTTKQVRLRCLWSSACVATHRQGL
eukprot:3134664-Prymnesium_polylepis.1